MTKNQIQVIESVEDQREIEIFDKQRKISIQKLFTPQGMDLMIDEIRKEVLAFEGDMTTKKGRAEIKSMAYKVACSKAPLEGLAKELKEEHQAAIDAVNEQVKKFKDKFDELRDEIRKPVDEMEAKEAAELKVRQDRLAEIERLSTTRAFNNVEDVRGLLKDLETAFDFNDWGNFEFKAKSTYEEAKKYLESEIEKGIKYEEEQKELAKLRAEAAERERKDHEAKIAKEAEERAKKQAEEEALKAKQEAEAREKRIQEEKIAAEAAKKAAEERAKEAERLRKEQEAQAEANRIAAEKKAKDDAKKAAEEAVKEEQRKVEAKRLADEAEAAKIAANKQHCAKIESEALADLKGIVFEAGEANESEMEEIIIQAIVKGRISNVSIKY